MASQDVSRPTEPFKDRSTGLMVYGLLQIAMGFLSALMVPLMLVSWQLGPQASGGATAAQMIPAAGLYGFFAVALIWLGVGSLLTRRWARALTLVLAWMWLVMGIMALVAFAVIMPDLSKAPAADGEQIPAQMLPLVYGMAIASMGCMYVVLPSIFIVFYQRADVKATCEAKDAKERWTDRCPLPVLSLSLLLGFGATSIVWSASYGFVVPFFGFILKGVPGALLFLGFGLLFSYLAWSTYKLRISAWWVTLGACLLFGLSTLVSFTRFSPLDLYREMGYPADQLKMMKDMGVLDLNIPLLTGGYMVVFIAYLIWVRRHWGQPS